MFLLLGSIPSPATGAIDLDPLQINAYGLMIALGVVAATLLASRRLVAAEAGTSEDMQSVAVWVVIGGVIGARSHHVVTDWDLFRYDLARIPLIWKGGLGIPGGLVGGLAAGWFVVRRRGLDVAVVLTAVAPATPLAQPIGRWVYLAGYFFGRFWIEGLRIDPAHELRGLRLNQRVSMVVESFSAMFLILDRVRRGPVSDDAATTQVQEFA